MIISSLSQIKSHALFYDCRHFIHANNVFLKLEGLNIAGSIKLKTAIHLIDGLEKRGLIKVGVTKIIESSSGNLGVALSIICKEKGYRFCCVTDPNISSTNEQLMKLYGAEIIKINNKDERGGYLGSRIKYIKELLARDPSYVWTNQYANHDNIHAHYTETAQEIISMFPHIDYLFVGAGTTGTLMGCAKYFKSQRAATQVIAVDAQGSVTFDFPSGKRFIPGLGTSLKPPIVDATCIDQIINVPENDTVHMCHKLLNDYGLLVGGSTGTVMSAIWKYPFPKENQVIVAISPDFGNKYIDTIYNNEWLARII